MVKQGGLGADLYLQRDEPPKKVSKLAIEAEIESDKYDTQTSVICYGCGGEEVERATGNVRSLRPSTRMAVLIYVGPTAAGSY